MRIQPTGSSSRVFLTTSTNANSSASSSPSRSSPYYSSFTSSSTSSTPSSSPSSSPNSSGSSSPPSFSRPSRSSSGAFANVTNHYLRNNSNMAATATATHHQYSTGSSSSSSSSHREYYCQFCQRRFNKSYNLMIHERSHFEDSFVCDVCGKGGFRNRDILRQHRSQHSPGGSSSSSTSSTSSCY